MLILSRKLEEEVMIGDTIRVKVLAVVDGQVKLGIVAPQEVKVYRSEVYEQIQKQNRQASRATREVVRSAAQLLGRGTSGRNRE
jgi:carbon storage regulator